MFDTECVSTAENREETRGVAYHLITDVLSSVCGIEPACEEDDDHENRGDPPAEFNGVRFWARTEFLPNEFLVIEFGFRQAAAVVALRLLSPARVVIRSAFRTGQRPTRHILSADGAYPPALAAESIFSRPSFREFSLEFHGGQHCIRKS